MQPVEQIPKGSSPEITPGGSQDEPGIYRHPQAKKQVITVPGEKGVIQANALTRLGFVKVGEVPSRIELQKMQKAQLAKDLAADAAQKAAEKTELEQMTAKAEADAEKAAAKAKADAATE